MTNLQSRLRELGNLLSHRDYAQATTCFSAADEIERLQSVASAEMKLREGNFAEIERLRAALYRISQDEFGDNQEPTWGEDSYWRVVNIARSTLEPEAPK